MKSKNDLIEKYILGGFGGGGGGGGGGNDMVTQEDTIFVSGMDPAATEMDIETHFGAIGIIKVSITICEF